VENKVYCSRGQNAAVKVGSGFLVPYPQFYLEAY
jgi:hypothetical protein